MSENRTIAKELYEQIPPIPDTEYIEIMKACGEHLRHLEIIALSTNEQLEGGSYYYHTTNEPAKELIPKQFNLMTLAKKCKKVIEIGFNMGHSALFMLMANPELKIDCFDICSHEYTELCFDYLSKKFPGRLRLYKGHSHSCLNKYEEPLADMAHVDGDHEMRVANIDFFLCRGRVKNNGIIVFDDTYLPQLQSLWQGYLYSGTIKPVEIIPTDQHAIGRLPYPVYNIAVCTLRLGDEYKKITHYGHVTKETYCRIHGYDLRDDEDTYDPSRPYAWSKVKLMQKCLEERKEDRSNKYDYIVWIDADTFIMNNDYKLEEFIVDLSGGRDVMLATDKEMINSGVIFMKNTSWSRLFLQTLWNHTDFLHANNWEQNAIIHMFDNNEIACKENMAVLPKELQTRFNSYHGLYRPGQFLVHLAGCFRDDKSHGLEKMMDQFCPLRMAHDSDEGYAWRMRFLGKDEN